MENLMSFVISLLAVSTVGVPIVAFLSKLLVDQLLRKDLEKLKSELAIWQALGIERAKYSFKEEADILRDLWPKVQKIRAACGSFDKEDQRQIAELQNANAELESFIISHAPFINVTIAIKAEEIVSHSDPESYESRSFSQVDKLVKEFITLYRERLLLR